MRYTRRRTLFAIAGPFRGPARRDDAGGSGGSTGSGSTEGGSGSTDGKTGGEGQADKDGQGDGTVGKTPNIDGDVDKERVARTIAAAREGEKKAKEAAKAADARVAAILQAAGLTPDGKTDPAEQLKEASAKAEAATAKAHDTAIELAVYKRAGKAGADPDALLDSLTFKTSVKELDLDAADFDDKVTAAIKAAVKANPKLAATAAGQGPGTQGVDHAGGGSQKTKPKNLTDAITAKLGG